MGFDGSRPMICGKIEERTTSYYCNRELIAIFNNKLQVQEVHNIIKSHAPSSIVNKEMPCSMRTWWRH